MYKGANWDGLIKTVSGCTAESARIIATMDPDISFFFFCRDNMVLEPTNGNPERVFFPGDAVFFSGAPTWGSAPQCDGYVKESVNVAYVGNGWVDLASTGDYTTAQGLNAVDIVCLFAANLNITPAQGAQRLAPNVTVPPGGTLACINTNVLPILQSGVAPLQAKGIAVLLTFLGNHDAAGWSNFSDDAGGAADAALFAEQLVDTVQTYGLNGIDIDDEYSNPTWTNNGSLAMVTTLLRQQLDAAFPQASQPKAITKARWSDLGNPDAFGTDWNGNSLASNLTYGFYMGYGTPPQYVFSGYLADGMTPPKLGMGFWTGQPSSDPQSDIQWLKTNGYAGYMVYAWGESGNTALMGQLVDAWMGPGNWNP
jgi:hypothetical protein